MYTSRNSGWLGPSGYIQTYPKIYPKPTLRTRLLAWRPFFAYLAAVAAVPLVVICGVNLYAAKLAVLQTDTTVPVITVPPATKPPVQILGISTAGSLASQPDSGLKQLLNDWQANHLNQEWSVVVQGVTQDGRSAKLNPELAHESANLYQLQLMYPLLKRHSPAEMAGIQLPAGNLADCASLMLRTSDNLCGDALGEYMGWAKSNSRLKELGLTATRLGDGMVTTADDMATFMKELSVGTKFSEPQRAYLTEVLASQSPKPGIGAGCNNCKVVQFSAESANARHNVAIIQDSGRAYVLSILTDGASYSQIAQLTSKIQRYLSN